MSERVARLVVLVAGACALSLAYWWPAFRNLDATGFGDWQMVHHNWEAALVTVTRFGELPVFDPFHCGGVSSIGNPEIQTYSPLFLLAFLFGSTVATKLFVVLHSAAALLGAYAYARGVTRLSDVSAAASAFVFSGSGFFAWHLAGGHATFAPFAFLPWLHLAARRGEDSPRAALLGGLLVGCTIAEGGTYPAPYMALSLVLAALVRVVGDPSRAWPVLRAGVLMGAVGVAVSLHRLVPVSETLARVPRTIGSVDSSRLADLVTMLTAREHDWPFPGHEFVWPEYGTYVGFPVLGLAALGSLRVFVRRVRSEVALHVLLGVAMVALVMGNASALHPWPLLRELPVFDSLRVPSRFLVVLTFHVAMLAGLGLDFLDARRLVGMRRRVSSVLALLGTVAIVVDLAAVTRPIVDRWDGEPIDATQRAPSRYFDDSRPYHPTYASLPRRNGATTLCYVGGMNWPISPALRRGPVPQVFSDDDVRISVRASTPASVEFDAETREEATVSLNLNHDPAFTSNVGRVFEDRGLLSVALPTGSHRVRVAYDTRRISLLLALSATAGALTALAALRYRRFPTHGRGRPP